MTQLSRRAREALELVRDVREPAPAVRQRGRQRLLASVATGALSSTAAAAEAAGCAAGVASLPTASLLGSVVGHFAIGLAVGLSAVAVTQVIEDMRQVEMPRREVAARGRVAMPSAAVRPLPPAPSAEVEAPRGVAVDLAPAAPRASLAAEMEHIERAQLELRRGDATAALVILSEYFAEHPRGVLVEEASAAQILALCAAGRREEGQRLASAFELTNPTSMLVPRVRRACLSR